MRRTFVVFIGVLAVAGIVASACGNKLPGPGEIRLGPSITLGALPTADNHDGDSFTFTATITGSGTISWSWSFGGGAVPDTASGSGGGDISVTVTLFNDSLTDDATYNGSITASDQFGERTVDFTYVVGERLNQPPVIESATYSAGTITVVASDPDGDPLTYTYEVTSGDVVVTESGATATVTVAPDVAFPFGDFPFTVRVSVTDGKGGEDSADVTDTLSVATPPDNAIWMVFDRTSANVGDTIGVTVWGINLANEFRYLNSVHIQFDNNLGYVTGSFDPGDPGGGWSTLDGIWALLSGVGILLPSSDGLFGPYPVTYTEDGTSFTNRSYIEANISPTPETAGVDPTPAPAGSTAALFYFEFTADSSGEALVRFVVNRDDQATPVTKYGLTGDGEYLFDASQEVTITIQ